ncbi:MAG: gamma carbonic anhydrase family protein [Spirochaetia bacterium]|nr:gamma carbonic anhydrase family protein [Spirochaetia bacterium]
MLIKFRNTYPDIKSGVFIAENASVIGDVKIGSGSSVWFGSVIRGDVHSIRIGDNTSIQDLSIIHVTGEKHSTEIGSCCTLGHRVTVHGARLADWSFVGIGATVLDGCELGEYSMLAAGSLLPPGKMIPPGMLAMGIPAKVVREVTSDEKKMFERTVARYAGLAKEYLEMKS